MIEARGRARFTREPVHRPSIRDVGLGDELDGGVATEPGIAGAERVAHGAPMLPMIVYELPAATRANA